MTSDPPKPLSRKAALSKLKAMMAQRIDEEQTLHDIWYFAGDRIKGEQADRAIALATASLLEEGLEECLLQHFVELTPEERARLFADDRGIFGTFAARIEGAYAIGAIGPHTRHDFTNIRYIRNAFAHVRTHLSFESPEIVALCDDLYWPTAPGLWKIFTNSVEGTRHKFVESARPRWLSLMFRKRGETRDGVLG
jgi:hypothetical protein